MTGTLWAPRSFDPLEEGDPSTGRPCAECGLPLKVGEVPTLVPKRGTGGGACMAVEAELRHWRCRPGVTFSCADCDNGLVHKPGCIHRPCGSFVRATDTDPFLVSSCGTCRHTEQACRTVTPSGIPFDYIEERK